MPSSILTSFSSLAQERASQNRNCANEPELLAWFGELFLEKFEFDADGDRAKMAWAWCSTVGRKHMLREGASHAFSPEPAALASGPDWIRKTVAAGRPLTSLALEPAERELFLAVLDWMRSSSGPALGSDWSKISVPQAKAAELAWIDAMGKAAAKRDLEAADASGTELFAVLGPRGEAAHVDGPASGSEWDGWRWVEVISADALHREGSLMSHCVGSYADNVASGCKRIFSLRDPTNAPKLTVEAKEADLLQIKAFANAACPTEWRPAVAAFAKAFEADAAARGLGVVSASDEMASAGVGSLPRLGLVVGELSADQQDMLKKWSEIALVASDEAWRNIGDVVPGLAALGLAGSLSMAAPFASAADIHAAFDDAATNGRAECLRLLIELSSPSARDVALFNAAKNGHAECVKLLIPVSNPKALNSHALCTAANEGHAECVALLIPVSDPKAAESKALSWAARSGQLECLRLLLPVCDPKANASKALYWAAVKGDAECVKLLIPFSDPKANESQALRAAAENGSMACVKLLLPLSDPLGKDSRGLTSQQLALEGGLPDVAAIIENFILHELKAHEFSSARLAEWQVARSAEAASPNKSSGPEGGPPPPQCSKA